VPRQLTAVFFFYLEDPSGGSVDQADWRPPAEPSEPRRCDAAGGVHAGSGPDAWPPTDDIDIAAGGPAPLALGGAISSIAGLETALPGLAFNPMPEGRVLVSWPRQGLEATLVFLEADEVFQVEALQFTFIEGLGPTPVEALRTREGLGAGSTCELVRGAFGTPGKENRLVDGDHRQWLTLTYLFGGTTAEFLCIEDALARLRLHSPAASR
jgi:hypothetical protein